MRTLPVAIAWQFIAWQFVIVSVFACIGPGSHLAADEFEDARQLLFSGDYGESIAAAELAIADGDDGERWFLLKIECQMATGQYDSALKTLDDGIQANADSVQIRLAGYEVCKHNDNLQKARELLIEFDDLVQYRRWKYRDAANQTAQGRYLMLLRTDAKQILDKFFLPAIARTPGYVGSYLAAGDLGLAKNDFGLAAEYYQKAADLQPENPACFMGLAHAWRSSDAEKSSAAISKTLELNPKYIPGLLYLVNDRIDSEGYTDANEFIDQILQVNPRDYRAWSSRAVIAHLQNDTKTEALARKKAFESWKGNPEVDYLIGKKLSQKYRFAEGARLQRRSLTYDPDFLHAKMQLANDLLRLGNDEEGWRLADEVYDQDGYNVVAYNLVTLGKDLARFSVLERDGFVVRMEPHEAEVYGEMVLDLLVEAKKDLCTKYKVKVAEPIFVEIFPKQQDFAIRTFGLPGGAGYLGVCFGRVITMNSPLSQSRMDSNWQSVLWHEFCHVVTLQKTENKMPRWLSEGISVYEESKKDPSWGQSMTAAFREMILGDDLTPVSELSGAFLKPDSGQALQFAYFESSLVVEYLIEEYGHETLTRILDDLKIGLPINESLGRYAGDVKLLDKEFAEFARERANNLAPMVNWDKPDLTAESTLAQWEQWNAAHPDNFYGLKSVATLLIGAAESSPGNATDQTELLTRAESLARKLLKLFPDYRGADNGYSLLAMIAKKRGDKKAGLEFLKESAKLQAASTDINSQIVELSIEQQDWAEVIRQSRRSLAVNPLVPAPWRSLADAAEKTGDHQVAATALKALASMDPFDPAETWYRYAVALEKSGRSDLARRQVLKCLEEAPRYRAAHRLLLKLTNAKKAEQAKTNSPDTRSSADQSDDDDGEASKANKVNQTSANNNDEDQ